MDTKGRVPPSLLRVAEGYASRLHLFCISITILASLVLYSPRLQAQPKPVSVCHNIGDGTVGKLHITPTELLLHMAHGDHILGPERCDGFDNDCDGEIDECESDGSGCADTCEAAVCGDGVVVGTEECDDGDANSDTEPDACRTDCRLPYCGDGVADSTDECDLEVQHQNTMPSRLVQVPDGRYFVTDPQAGSVFIFDESLVLTGEIAGFNVPLGIAYNSLDGQIYVGEEGSDTIKIISTAGESTGTIADGAIGRPADLDFDSTGNLYVVDADSRIIKVYDAYGAFALEIGSDILTYPISVAVADLNVGKGEEVFVGDLVSGTIEVFSTEGTHDRSLGSKASTYSTVWEARFVRIHSIKPDPETGSIYIVDSYQNKIQILDALDGNYMESFGEFGTDPGELNMPLDVCINSAREAIVANSGNHCLEVGYVIP